MDILATADQFLHSQGFFCSSHCSACA